MTTEQNKTTLMHAADAFNEPEERSAWFEIHGADVVAHGLGPDPLDLEDLKRFYTTLWAGFPDLRISVDDLVGERDTVAWRLSVTGTHLGEFRGIPPTGTEVSFGAQYFFRFDDGVIVERWTNFDRLGVLAQLGAVPLPT